MSPFLTPDQLCSLVKARYERIIVQYGDYCRIQGIDPLAVSSVHGYLESRVAATRNRPFRFLAQQLRRFFLESGRADPFGSPRQFAVLKRLIRRAPRSVSSPTFSSRAYHDVIDSIPNTTTGARDAALLGLIYAGMLGGPDIAALDPEHVTFSHMGLRALLVASPKRAPLTLRRYPDPRYCPVALLERWFRVIEFTPPGFRISRRGIIQPQRIARGSITSVVHDRLRGAGLPPGGLRSLKATMVTVAAMRGAPESSICAQGGFKTSTALIALKKSGALGPVSATQRMGF